MEQMVQESATCDSVAKWMSNCSDNRPGPARQFVVWFSFYWQNVSPPLKFTIKWYSCQVTNVLHCSMSRNGADSSEMVECTRLVMTIAPVEPAHRRWKRIQHERCNWFWQTNMPQSEIFPLLWSRPAELSTAMFVKNCDKTVWNS
jgi:hypothetical protein